ncbi:hypothetical protein [Actinophytocola sp.]|uniref:hypothetical protein n=1 Tax=Actinophytocola sp. TaxID=1872138 RepID=UPI003D6B04DD
MSLYEIDHATTQARLDAITASGLRALGECAHRSEEIDEQVREMLERREREKQALDELVKQAREQQAQDKRAEPEQPARRATTPTTLMLGAEELRAARRAAEPEPAAAKGQLPTAASGRVDEPSGQAGPPTRRTLVLGAPEDREPRPEPRPSAERRAPVEPTWPSAENDEDLSGRTWLR